MLMKTVLALVMLAIVSLSNAEGQGPFQFAADLSLLEPLPSHPELSGDVGSSRLGGLSSITGPVWRR